MPKIKKPAAATLTTQDFHAKDMVELKRILQYYEIDDPNVDEGDISGGKVRSLSPEWLAKFSAQTLGSKLKTLRASLKKNKGQCRFFFTTFELSPFSPTQQSDYDPRLEKMPMNLSGNKRSAVIQDDDEDEDDDQLLMPLPRQNSTPRPMSTPVSVRRPTQQVLSPNLVSAASASEYGPTKNKGAHSPSLHEIFRFLDVETGNNMVGLIIKTVVNHAVSYSVSSDGMKVTCLFTPNSADPTDYINDEDGMTPENLSIIQYFHGATRAPMKYIIDMPEAIDATRIGSRPVLREKNVMSFADDGKEEGMVKIMQPTATIFYHWISAQKVEEAPTEDW